MSSKIPLVKDLLDTYPNTNISNHVDSKMIEMHNAFSAGNIVNYSNEDICDYIKFINMSCMDINCYKHVVIYINKDNIHIFNPLFDNYDILYELFPLLSYDTVSEHPIFNDPNYKEIKDRWIVHNMTWIKRYNTELLEPYIKVKTLMAKYYVIGETIYSNHTKINPRLKESLIILYELEHVGSNGHLDLVKYLFNTLDDIYGVDLMKACMYPSYTFIEVFCNAICLACENNHLEVVKYIIGFFKSKNALHLTKKGDQYSSPYWINYSINNIEIVKYLLEDEDLKPYVTMDVRHNLFKVTKSGKVEMVDFLIKLGGDINDEFKPKKGDLLFKYYPLKDELRDAKKFDLLTVSSFYGHLGVVEYLIDNGIDVRKYGKKSIMYASVNAHTDIMKYVTDKLMDIIGNNIDEKDNFINALLESGNKEIITHIVKNYPFDHIVDYTKNVDVLLSSAYIGGQIEFIEKFYRIIMFNITHLESEKIISIINNNSEGDCIKFISFLIANNVLVRSTLYIMKICIGKGYIDLLFLINNNTFELSDDDVITCIEYSTSEESSIRLIKFMSDKNAIEETNLPKIMSMAVKKGYLKLLKLIYETIIVHFVRSMRSTILSLENLIYDACDSNNIEIIKYLLSINEDINRNNVKFAEVINIIFKKCKSFEIIKHLLDNGLKIPILFENLYKHIRMCDPELFEKTIKYVYDGKFIEIDSKVSRIMFTSMCNNYKDELVEYMLLKGIKMDISINTALEFAVNTCNEKIVKLITDNVDHIMFIKSNSEFLVTACINKSLDIVKILVKYINVNEHDGLALMKACINGSLEIVVHLIENGVDFKLYSNKALRVSAKYGHVDIVKYLIEKGADVSAIDKKYHDKYVEAYLLEIGVNIKFDKVAIKVGGGEKDEYYSDDETYDDFDSEW